MLIVVCNFYRQRKLRKACMFPTSLMIALQQKRFSRLFGYGGPLILVRSRWLMVEITSYFMRDGLHNLDIQCKLFKHYKHNKIKASNVNITTSVTVKTSGLVDLLYSY